MLPTDIDSLRQRWETERTPQLCLQLAEEYRKAERLDQAVEVLEDAARIHPNHLAPQVALGRYRLELGELDGAAEVLEQVVDRDPTHLVANKLLVGVYTRLGDRKKARDRLDLYALLNDGDPEIEELTRQLDAPAAATEGDLFEVPRPAAAAALDVPLPPSRSSVRIVSDADPFQVPRAGTAVADYWSSLASEGLFSVTAPTAATAVAAPEPEVAGESAAVAEPEPATEPEPPMEAMEAAPEVSTGIADGPVEPAAEVAAEAGPLTAAELLADRGGDTSVHARKMALLRNYLDRLRAGRDRHV